MGDTAGAKNIYDKIYTNSGETDPEYLFQQDPYAIFIDSPNFEDPNSYGIEGGFTSNLKETKNSMDALIKSRHGFENLNSVKNNRIYAINNDIMRTLKDYVTIEYIGKALYPEEFAEFDPVKENKEFIEKYVPVLPTDGAFFYQLGE